MQSWQVAKKELRLLVRDRRALIVLIVFPVTFIAILGVSTGRLLGWREENQLLSIAVVDQDCSDIARQLIESLASHDGLNVRRIRNRRKARELIAQRDANVALFIGPSFHERVETLKLRDILDSKHGQLAGGLASLDVMIEYKSTAVTTGTIVEHLVFADTLRVLVPYVAKKNKLVARLMENMHRKNQKLRGPSTKLKTFASPISQKWKVATPEPQSTRSGSVVYQKIVPSYTVMFAFFLINIMARAFISERDLGTLRRLRLSPITPSGLLAGKTLPFLIISLLQSILLFLFGKLLFGMSWGTTPWLLIPVILTTSMAATSLGLLVATMVRTDSQVSAYANFLVITMAGISGCFMPREWLPQSMQTFSLITPHAWALIAYDQIFSAQVPNQTTVVGCCAVLTGFACVSFALGYWRFRGMDS